MNSATASLSMLQTISPVDPMASALLSPETHGEAHGALPTFCLHHQAICPIGAAHSGGWVEFLIRGTGAYAGLSPPELVRVGYYNHGAAFDLAVVEQALRLGRRLHPSTRLGINIHPESLHQSSFVDDLLRRVLDRPGMAQRVVLELIEFQGAIELKSCRPALQRLRRHGLRIALDDFGPGFPNLDVMAAGLIDAVKLDRSLVTNLDHAPLQLQLLSGLVELAGRTGLELVAEGIETISQFERLRSIGVRWMQGFLFGRPCPVRPRAAIRPASPNHMSPTHRSSAPASARPSSKRPVSACPSRQFPSHTQTNPKEIHP